MTTIEANETEETDDGPDARTAYDAFNVLWSKVPRSYRAEDATKERMLIVRAFFDQRLAEESERQEAERREAIVDGALGPKPEGVTTEETEEPPTAVHLALRVCRTLKPRDWAMLKAIVELDKFGPDGFLEIARELEETRCPDCGLWLDDDDAHDDCPNASVEEEEEKAETAMPSPAAVDGMRGDPPGVAPLPPDAPRDPYAGPAPEAMHGACDGDGGEDPYGSEERE